MGAVDEPIDRLPIRGDLRPLSKEQIQQRIDMARERLLYVLENPARADLVLLIKSYEDLLDHWVPETGKT